MRPPPEWDRRRARDRNKGVRGNREISPDISRWFHERALWRYSDCIRRSLYWQFSRKRFARTRLEEHRHASADHRGERSTRWLSAARMSGAGGVRRRLERTPTRRVVRLSLASS